MNAEARITELRERIETVKGKSLTAPAMAYLSELLPLYEELENVLRDRIAEIESEVGAISETAKHLRVVRMLSEGQVAEHNVEQGLMFSPLMSTRDCAIEVLRKRGEWMGTKELAKMISAGGKPLGNQPLSAVSNAMKNELDTVFVRKKPAKGRGFLYTLKELVDEDGELSMFETTTSG